MNIFSQAVFLVVGIVHALDKHLSCNLKRDTKNCRRYTTISYVIALPNSLSGQIEHNQDIRIENNQMVHSRRNQSFSYRAKLV